MYETSGPEGSGLPKNDTTTSTSFSLAEELVGHMNQEATSTSTSSSSASSRFVGIVRIRDDAKVARHVRQNVGRSLLNDGKGIYLRRVDIMKDELKNIKMVKSNTAGIVTQRPYNPNSGLISLEELINDGS